MEKRVADSNRLQCHNDSGELSYKEHSEHSDAAIRLEFTSALTAVGFGCYWAWSLAFMTMLLFPEADVISGLVIRLIVFAIMASVQLTVHLCRARTQINFLPRKPTVAVTAICAIPLIAIIIAQQAVTLIPTLTIPLGITMVAAAAFGVSAGMLLLSWGAVWSTVDRSKPFNRSTAKGIACSFLMAGLLLIVVCFAPIEIRAVSVTLLYAVSFALQLLCSQRLPRKAISDGEMHGPRLRLFSRSRYMPLFIGVTAGGVLTYLCLTASPTTEIAMLATGLMAASIAVLAFIAIFKRIIMLSTFERVSVPLIAVCCLVLAFIPQPYNYTCLPILFAVLALYFILHWNILLIVSYKHHPDPVDHFAQAAIAPLEGLALGILVPLVCTILGINPEQLLLLGSMILLFGATLVPAITKYASNTAVESLSLSEARGLEMLTDDDIALHPFSNGNGYKTHGFAHNKSSIPDSLTLDVATNTDSDYSDSRIGSWRSRCLGICKKHGLSPREAEVFFLLAKGRNAEHIHNELFISIYTAKTHGYRIYRKLGVNSQQELIDMVDKYYEQ
jgi:DNA-binding CsgD family transcriptional regulator